MEAVPLVLIVDDNARNRKLARDLLGVAGFRTLEAGNAAEAVAVATEWLPDVVLLDLRLPDRDGVEVARELRDGARTARIPVVALTALTVDPADDWVLDAGFAGVIGKPIDIDTFAELVRGFCVRRVD